MWPTADLDRYPSVASLNPIVIIALASIWWTLRGFIGWLIAHDKGRGKAGFWWSFFLGSVGWVVAALLTPTVAVEVKRYADLRARLNGTIVPRVPVDRAP